MSPADASMPDDAPLTAAAADLVIIGEDRRRAGEHPYVVGGLSTAAAMVGCSGERESGEQWRGGDGQTVVLSAAKK